MYAAGNTAGIPMLCFHISGDKLLALDKQIDNLKVLSILSESEK